MRRNWRKSVALAFILWAFADLLVPGLCKADAPAANPNGTILAVTQTFVASEHTLPDQSKAPNQDSEDDCFCCSAHVVPSSMIAAVTLETFHQDRSITRIDSPSEVAFPFYHPPRS